MSCHTCIMANIITKILPYSAIVLDIKSYLSCNIINKMKNKKIPSEIVRSFKCFLHVSKMPSLMYNQVNSFIIENAMILNIIQHICNLPDSEVVWQNSVTIVNLIPYIVRCSRLTVYFSTKCQYLPKSFLKEKMRGFFKNLDLIDQYSAYVDVVKVLIQSSNSRVVYEL